MRHFCLLPSTTLKDSLEHFARGALQLRSSTEVCFHNDQIRSFPSIR